MRKLNAILGPVMIVLLLIHAVSGAFQLAGIMPGGSVIRSVLSCLLLAAAAVHAVIGIKLTADTLIACRRAGTSYFRNNERFWISRVSGFALLVFIIWHVLAFTGTSGEAFRLQMFDGLSLAAHILLAVTLLIHLFSNIRPLFIALGIENRKWIRDILILLSIVMLAAAAAFIVYYLRWNVMWRYGK